MLPKDSIQNTFLVSIVLCVVCSLLVSGAAVLLKPMQDRNKLLDRQRNIIEAAGLSEDSKGLSGAEVKEIFDARVTAQLVDLSTGDYVADADKAFEPRKAAKVPATSKEIESSFNIGLARRELQTWVYLVKDDADKVQQVILPIYGMGLWSTLYGYVAIDSDLHTIKGLTYYEHGETPGLGGEVENPTWKAKWIGKQIWTEGVTVKEAKDSDLRVGVAKGAPVGDGVNYMVDGLSGATITSRGVDSMMKYWFSDDGFGTFLKKLASQQGASNGSPNS